METNLKFNSQICTTKIQSERLIALGLKKDTADMVLLKELAYDEKRHCLCDADTYMIRPIDYLNGEEHRDNIPAWSLHRLIEMAQLPQSWQCLSGDWYNEIIAHIQSMIHINQFNKDYLEERV